MSDFNGGNVWGRVVSVKRERSKKKSPYLAVLVDCSGPRGNVRVYGRLWGEDRIESFLSQFKADASALVRFRGFFGQYKKGDDVLSNYTFFNWEPSAGQEPRAAFVLSGSVVDFDVFEGLLRVRVIRPAKNGYPEVDEVFEVFAPGFECEAGQRVEVKGCLQQGEGEDDFGVATGPVRPVVSVLRDLTADSPF